jgi:hypothetical protein
MNRKGDLGDNVWSGLGFFIFMLGIMGGVIVAGMYLLFGQGYDFREAEAELLNFKIKNCILEQDFSEGVRAMFFEDLIENCDLNREVIERDLIVKVCSGGGDCVKSEDPEFTSGGNFQSCELEKTSSKGFHECVGQEFLKSGEIFEVVAGSKQHSRGVQ